MATREHFNPTGHTAVLHLQTMKDAKRIRELYEATGELQSLDQAPFINVAWQAARCGVNYALQLGVSIEQLPKRFNWLGIPYRLVFPPEGQVQILCPETEENLCHGLAGWVDPMKVTKTKARP